MKERNLTYVTDFTARYGRVLNTPASYSGRPGLKLGTHTGYPDWGFSWFFLRPSVQIRDSTLKLVHDRFLHNHFQFIIIHLSPYHRCYLV
jgi:hypothetical protein